MIETTSLHQLDGVNKPLADTIDRMSSMAHDGVAKAMDSSQHLRELAVKAGERSLSTIREEPVKYVLIAAATGAALMALITLVSRAGSRHH